MNKLRSNGTAFVAALLAALLALVCQPLALQAASVARSASLPKGHVRGLALRWGSATTVVLEKGEARSAADDVDQTLSSEVTIDITTAAAVNGLDVKTSSATISTTNTSPNATASASIVADLNAQTPTFTSFSTSSTALTGVGTSFITKGELKVNDVLGNSVKGYSRVTAVLTDTTATLVAALPGGDAGGGSVGLVVFQNPTLQAAAQAVCRINTLDSAGTALVLSANASATASGQTLKFGGEIVSGWYSVWLVSGTSGSGGFLSTQRTSFYGAPSGYSSAKRRVSWIRNMASGDIAAFTMRTYGAYRETIWQEASQFDNSRVLSGGTANATWTAVDCSGIVPPTSTIMLTASQQGAASKTAFWRPRSTGVSTVGRNVYNTGSATTFMGFVVNLDLDGAQVGDYSNNAAGASFTVDAAGFGEDLSNTRTGG